MGHIGIYKAVMVMDKPQKERPREVVKVNNVTDRKGNAPPRHIMAHFGDKTVQAGCSKSDR